jgi:hypothetical protein
MQFRAGLIQQKNQAVRAVGSENRLPTIGGNGAMSVSASCTRIEFDWLS